MFCSVPTERAIENYKKIAKKKKKIKKIPLWLHFQPKFVGKCREREKIKFIDPFRSFPKCKRKFQKNRKNIQKIKKKNHYVFISWQNRTGKAEKEKK